MDHKVDGFEQRECGCPVEGSQFPYLCYAHVNPRRMITDNVWAASTWAFQHQCGYCGRVNPGGLACGWDYTCELCGVCSCDRHDMATYKLRIACPRNINPRTKYGKALLRGIAQIGGGRA